MKTSRWAVVAVAMVLLSGQLATASQGRRRSAGIGDGKVEIEGVIKTPGTTSLVITTSHKDDVTVMLTDTTVIRHGDTTIAAVDLKAGQRVHAKATSANGTLTATQIEVQDENEKEGEASAKGVVKSVGTDSLVVTTASGDVTVNVDGHTIIRSGAKALTLADIKAGDLVEAEGTKIDDHTLLAKLVQVENENENEHEAAISGVVKSAGKSSLVVTTSKGDVTVNVDGATKITKQGKAITLADVAVGDHVEAEGTLADPQTLNATKIQDETENENENEAEIEGTVKSVGTSSLVVTTSKGDVTVNVDSHTEIRRDGAHLALSDIKAGNRVEAEGTMTGATTMNAQKISVKGAGK